MSVKYFGSDALNKLIDLVKTALGLKADDSNVVHKTGDETVGGTKTFSNLTYHSRANSDSPLYIKGSSDQSWIGFTSATGDTLSPFGYLGVKSDNKPYFYSGGAKRLALLDETMPYYYKYVSGETHDCNDWTSQGIYVDYNVTNAPLTGWVTIITLLAGYPRQICYPYLSDKVYCRYKNSSTWSAWHHSGVNYGTDPDYCGNLATMKNTGTWEDGINISQGITETSGIHIDGASIKMWSPCDDGSLIYYDEDNGQEVWRIGYNGCLVGGMSDPSDTANNIWFGKDSNGKWGYKTSKTGTVTPFSNPTGILTTGWFILESYTWTRSAGGAYYVAGGIDIGLSSGNTIISITMADWSNISANYMIQPYRSGGSKIGLMSNTDSFNDSSALKFIVTYV